MVINIFGFEVSQKKAHRAFFCDMINIKNEIY